ncbi:NADH dehydrogenase [ubiquinone] 1 beta subcomplex subunit 7 [Fopius arisanus]|uniref:NADH dehydrogenase [ubiquinone] 1 beta subcomplex subunit 7 n=1 Tax=Fopius arisanus TaxID=64838 RepID=A0A0C9R4L9_9HYME|nr:PREDICTED: NADH dehydrogenase [ubiquinone] 1 beta subcomplex subunit 7 [Fopius arisanus]
MGSGLALMIKPEVTPMGDDPPSFDAMLGFKNGRKPRVMVATQQEMRAARIEDEFRDYCAHHYLQLEVCRRENFPWVMKCGAEKHKWDVCAYEDYVLRMKEYERERRLLERQCKKKQAAAA